MNKMPKKCVCCGRFVAWRELEDGGGASADFIPDNYFGPETFAVRCKRCTEKEGAVRLYQYGAG